MYGASPLTALGPFVHSFPLMGLAWIVKQPLGLQKVTKVTSWRFLGYLTVCWNGACRVVRSRVPAPGALRLCRADWLLSLLAGDRGYPVIPLTCAKIMPSSDPA
jgi:hypothetical protein